MSTFENEQQAAEALAAAVREDGNERSDVAAINNRADEIRQEQATPPADGSDTGTTETDSFTNIDPNTLPPELQAQYRNMQGAFTKRMQELSERDNQYAALDEFGGPDAALEAAQFATALATDPQYALAVHEQLSTALQEAGLTPREAAQEASRQMGEAAGQGQVDADDDLGIGFGDEPDSRLVQQLQSVESELNELRQWREAQEELAFHQALDAEMDMQERRVFQSHPEYTDFDRENLYNLAYSTGGNLEAADEIYQGLRSGLIEQYIQQKGAVPTGITPVSAGPSDADEPVDGIRDLFDPRLDKLVQERLAQLAAAE